MNPSLASLICVCGTAGLFYLNRDDSVRTSKALWLPVIYLWIVGSRSLSTWLGVAPANGTNVQLDGSPVDALFFGLLLGVAIIVLFFRSKSKAIGTLLTTNWLILIYFLYCLVSISWAYYPDVGLKRWIKSIDDLVMVLLIVTDDEPLAAFKRLISRVGFVLLPASILFIKYYGDLGRGYDPSGGQMNTGVTTNKNSLGLIVLVVTLATLWNFRGLLINKDAPNRGRRLVAQGTLLAFGLVLLEMADSATCIACFFLGAGLMFATSLRAIRNRPGTVHALCLGILLIGGLATLFAGSVVTGSLGRKSNLSGRTEIWAAVIPAVSNSIVGDGYDSFWIGPDEKKVVRSLVGWWHPEDLNEAHNGYIETYLNLGWIGVCLIALILLSGYKRTIAAFRLDRTIGGMLLAYVVVAAVYNITESGFGSPHLMWFFLLLAIAGATGVCAGFFGDGIHASRGAAVTRKAAVDKRISGSGTVIAVRNAGEYAPRIRGLSQMDPER